MLVVVAVGITGDFVITLVCMLGKFNGSKKGVRDDIMDNSFDSIGFRLAFGPCLDDPPLLAETPLPPVVLATAFVEVVPLLAVVVTGLPKSKLFCCK